MTTNYHFNPHDLVPNEIWLFGRYLNKTNILQISKQKLVLQMQIEVDNPKHTFKCNGKPP